MTMAKAACRNGDHNKEELEYLCDLFPTLHLDDVSSAYERMNCDVARAADILADLQGTEGVRIHCKKTDDDFPLLASSSLSASAAPASSSSKGKSKHKAKPKKMSISIGSVSNFIGNGNARGAPSQPDGASAWKTEDKSAAKRMFFSEREIYGESSGMSAQSSGLNADDGLGQCGYNVEKFQSAMEQLKALFPDLPESVLFAVLKESNFSYSEALKVLQENINLPTNAGPDKSGLLQKIIESLFQTEERMEQQQHIISGMTLRRKKIRNTAEISDNPNILEKTEEKPVDVAVEKENDEYTHFKSIAANNWETMKAYYEEAAIAYSNGEHDRATYLFQEGNRYKEIALQAQEKASEEICKVKTLESENEITIDLHSQGYKEAVSLLKLHIRSLTCLSSIQTLRVLIGDGENSKTKRACKLYQVSKFLKKEGINWIEEGEMLIIHMAELDLQKISFLAHDSDS